MRDYKGYRLYAATRPTGQVAFITRNDGDRVWGIGFGLPPSDDELGRQTHARIEGWERDPGDPWADAYLFDRSEYTNVREVEIDPSQREERYVVEATTADPGYNYILRDTETNEFSSYRTEFNAKHTAIRLNDGTYARTEYIWRKEETVKKDRVRTGTAIFVNSPNTDRTRYFVEVGGDERVYFSRKGAQDATATYLRGDEDRTLEDAEDKYGFGQGRDTAAYRAEYYTDVKYDDTPEEETVSEETDYKAAYEKTIEALRKEAEKRGWCTEFDDFVSENNLPETLIETKVRVTLELTVPGRTPTIREIEDAVAAATSVQGFKNVEWETI